jgi:hypothetical protein
VPFILFSNHVVKTATKYLTLDGLAMPKIYYAKVVFPSGGFNPSSWTITRPLVGQIHIVHNFGSTTYAVTVNGNTYAAPGIFTVDNLTANYFDIFTFDAATLLAADIDFSLIVAKQV